MSFFPRLGSVQHSGTLAPHIWAERVNSLLSAPSAALRRIRTSQSLVIEVVLALLTYFVKVGYETLRFIDLLPAATNI